MSKREIESIANSTIRNLGRATAHYLFPNDIDFYYMALELVNSENRTVDFFAFPVFPKSIIFQDTEATNVQRTLGGISVIKTTAFDPKTLTLQGDFGRNFKVIVGGRPFNFTGINVSSEEGFSPQNFATRFNELSFTIKNGYGCVKILERIIKSSDQLDANNNPFKLFLYNTSLNQKFLIEPQDFTFSQNMQNNMIWNYNVRFKIIANLEDLNVFAKKNLVNLLLADSINKAANSVFRSVTKALL